MKAINDEQQPAISPYSMISVEMRRFQPIIITPTAL